MRSILVVLLTCSVILVSCISTPTKENLFSSLQKGNEAYAKKDYKAAIKNYQVFLKNEKEPEIESKLVDSMWNEKEYAHILEWFENNPPQSIEFLLIQANAAFLLGAKEKSNRILAQVVGKESFSFESLFELAQKTQNQGGNDLAYKLYSTCVLLNPEDVMSHNNRAYVIININGDYQQAIDDLTYPIKAFVDDPWCRRMTAHVYYRMAKYEQALEKYHEALSLYSDKNEYGQNGQMLGKIELLLGIARSNKQLGKIDAAKSAYMQALEIGSEEAKTEVNGL